MSEAELVAAFEAAWSNEGFLSREHEEARLEAGRGGAPPVPRGAAPAGRGRPGLGRARVRFALDGDRIRGRFDRVDIVPVAAAGRRSPARPRTREAPSVLRADVVEPMLELLGRERGHDHRLQVERRPRPGRGAAARAGLAPAADLRDGLRGDDRPPAGRRPAALPRLGARRAGRGGAARDSRRPAAKIATAAAGIRARDYTAKPERLDVHATARSGRSARRASRREPVRAPARSRGDHVRLRQHARPGRTAGSAVPSSRTRPMRSSSARAVRPRRLPGRLGGGARAAVPRGGAASSARPTSPARSSGSSPGSAACRRRRSTAAGTTRAAAALVDPDEIGGPSTTRTARRSSTACRRPPTRSRLLERLAATAVRARDPLELAARGDDRPLRRGDTAGRRSSARSS